MAGMRRTPNQSEVRERYEKKGEREWVEGRGRQMIPP